MKGGPPANVANVFSYVRLICFCSCDLDLNPMILIYGLDLMTKITSLGDSFQKLESKQDRQRDRQTRPNTLPHRIRMFRQT